MAHAGARPRAPRPTSWSPSCVDVRGVDRGRRALRRHGHLSRFLLRPARARRRGSSRASCSAASPGSTWSSCRTREVCCGFGGTFCVKYPDISNAMVERQGAATSTATGADTLLAGDLGCLMNMAGKLKRQGVDVRVRHVAEVLAGHDRRAGDRRRPGDGPGDGMQTHAIERQQTFKENARAALADPQLQQALAQGEGGLHRQARRGAWRGCPNSTRCATRRATSRTTRWPISTSISSAIEAQGDARAAGRCTGARTAAEARETILDICRAAGART